MGNPSPNRMGTIVCPAVGPGVDGNDVNVNPLSTNPTEVCGFVTKMFGPVKVKKENT
jgi:hypothetical protein